MRHDYFSVIDSAEKAYWLGFLAADGNVYRGGHDNRIALALKESDRIHVQKFADVLQVNRPIRSIIKTKSVWLAIHSRAMCDHLENHGVVPRKSLILRPWNGDPELMPHYWRGIFDGDGSIGKHQDGRTTTWFIHLCGTEAIVVAFKEFVDSIGQTGKTRGIFDFRCGGLRPPQHVMSRLLYQEDHVSLDRKRVLALELLAQKPLRALIRHLSLEDMNSLRDQHGSWSQVARYLGVSEQGVGRHLNVLGFPRSGIPWRRNRS